MGDGEVSLVGLQGGEWFGAAAGQALAEADVLIGSARHLDHLDVAGERVPLTMPVTAVLDLAGERQARGQRVAVLASGDPGFFGLARLASARFGDHLRVYPAPSSVSLAFARLGLNWDDAVVVSAHGRAAEAAVGAVRRHPKVAALTSPGSPPEALGATLVATMCPARDVAVCTRLGEPGEAVVRCDVGGLAAGRFDPLSIVVFLAPAASEAAVAWGLPDPTYAHRDGMVTKAEVRAVALGKLAIPAAGVMWDVGAGSGSVAVECARLAPGLAVYAVERRTDDLERLRANTGLTAVRVVEGEAPGCLAGLPDPDRVFVGGGGLDVLDAVLARLRPGGAIVATYAALDRAAEAARRLGQVVQVAVSRGTPIGPDGSLRLAAENPVFVCWGPTP